MPLNIGQVVKLKSGGPEMTVARTVRANERVRGRDVQNYDRVFCTWFIGKKKDAALFAEAALDIVVAPSKCDSPDEEAAEDSDDPAIWLAAKIRERGVLDHADAVDMLERKFGTSVVDCNEAGNLAIAPAVLARFRKLASSITWDLQDQHWIALDS